MKIIINYINFDKEELIKYLTSLKEVNLVKIDRNNFYITHAVSKKILL